MKATLFTRCGEILSLGKLAKKMGRLPVEADLDLHPKGFNLIVAQGKILWIGRPSKKMSTFLKDHSISVDRETDLENKNLFPAFSECHTHTVYAGSRAHEFEQRLNGASYQEIAAQGGGILSTVRAVRKSTSESLIAESQARVNGFVRQGVVTLEIKTGYGLTTAAELKMLETIQKMKGPDIVATFLGAHTVPVDYKNNAQAFINKILIPLARRIACQKLAERADIFIESGFFSIEDARPYLKELKSLGFEITIHADQLSRTGSSLLGVEVGACSIDHAICISSDDVLRIAKSEVTSVLLPAADFYMRVGYPPARALLDAGARVALATDYNPGTSPMQDLAFVGVLARLEMKMTLPEVWAGYTLNSAYALRREKQIGSIEVGKDASFFNSEADWTQFFYEVGRQPVHTLWKKGRVLVKNRE